MSSTGLRTKHQEEALKAEEQPVEEIEPRPVVASSSSSPDKAVSSEATSPFMIRNCEGGWLQVEAVRESSSQLIDV